MAKAKSATNGFDGEQLAAYLGEIDKADDELSKLKSEHMESCKRPRGWLRDTMASVKEAGINMNAFRAVVAEHRADRKIEKTLAELEADDAADFEAMREALGPFGETPLGEAALDKAKGRAGKGEQLDALRS